MSVINDSTRLKELLIVAASGVKVWQSQAFRLVSTDASRRDRFAFA